MKIGQKTLFSWLLLFFMLLSYCRTKIPVVMISTGFGDISLEIFVEKAPVTANNFLRYVDKGLYDSAMFYRVVRMDNQPHSEIKIEVIQGGFYDKMDELAYFPIRHETTELTGIKHQNGVVSMARYTPGTASSEFFICIGDQPQLDYMGIRNPDGMGFAAFGKVKSGMDVVRQIQHQADTNQYLIHPVRISKMERSH